MSDCVFCLVTRKEIPAKVIYEDDEVLAFDDIAPQAPVHTLVIPKHHYATMDDEVPEALMGKLMATAALVARMKGVDKTGYRIIVNNGSDAAQTVKHLHLHVVGGRPMSHGMVGFGE